MSPQTSFSDRIDRIQKRAAGVEPKAPVIAPMVGEDVREMRTRRSSVGLALRRLMLPIAVAAFIAGLFSGELIAMLPPQVATEMLTRPDTLGDLMRAQVTPEQLDRVLAQASASQPAVNPVD
ncbi:hypothetical protein ACFO5X_17195 [Seohaeicola nanhaiensis]|uniref:Uncharacterized protein n=1 Tax=Seohaeicola nanhaiensis TaxID=1387282 RepID=A0ABV9KJG3_9RHOB